MPKKKKKHISKRIGQYVVLPLILVLAIGSLIASFVNNKPKANQGFTAPALNIADLNGQQVDLDELKGKIVLLDFWASWCKPCRKQNPFLRSLYSEYSKNSFKSAEGFEIVSVSLDTEREKWIKSIEDDSLNWKMHLSDLEGWESPAIKSFEVTFLPSSFLINERGTIIGKNLSKQKLINELDKRLVQPQAVN